MSRLNPEQAEQLKEIGAYLRLHRQEQSISTEEVAAKTFIQSRLLKALEEGQLEQLPEPVFIQGFIRRYADALKLDGAALAETFPTGSLPIKSDTCKLEVLKEPPQHNLALFMEEIGQKWQAYVTMSSKSLSKARQPYILYLVIGVALAGGLLYLLTRPQTDKVHPQKKHSPAVEPQKIVAQSVSTSPASPKDAKLITPIQVSPTQ